METIIKKAIDGGYHSGEFANYKARTGTLSYRDYEPGGWYSIENMSDKDIVCDNQFWRALGKACGWEDDTQYDLTAGEQFSYGEWFSIAIEFHEINLTDGWITAINNLNTIISVNRNI